MSRLFENIAAGAMVGRTIGWALDALVIGGATITAGPVGFLASTKAVICKEAAGTLIGGSAGVVKTVVEERR